MGSIENLLTVLDGIMGCLSWQRFLTSGAKASSPKYFSSSLSWATAMTAGKKRVGRVGRVQAMPARTEDPPKSTARTFLKRLGWRKFVLQRHAKGDFTSLDGVHHPAKRLLKHYKSGGAPVKISTEP